MARRIPSSAQRGAALLLAIIVIAIATLMVVGAISFTGTERSAAINQTRIDTVAACRLAARNALLSKVRMGGSTPADIVLDEPLGDGKRVITGHDTGTTTPPTPVATGKVLASDKSGWGAQDVSNKYGGQAGASAGAGAGGPVDASELTGSLLSTPYMVTVLCVEPDGRQHELEFAVRIGI